MQKLPWPLGYLCLCKGEDGGAGGGDMLPALWCSMDRAGHPHRAGGLQGKQVSRDNSWAGGGAFPHHCAGSTASPTAGL